MKTIDGARDRSVRRRAPSRSALAAIFSLIGALASAPAEPSHEVVSLDGAEPGEPTVDWWNR